MAKVVITNVMVEYGKWTVARLKTELISRGATTTGRKADLIERLVLNVLLSNSNYCYFGVLLHFAGKCHAHQLMSISMIAGNFTVS